MSHGIHPDPSAVIVHLSDTHLLAGGAPLADLVDTEGHLRQLAERLRVAAPDADAIVVSGDVADLGEPEAYALAREILEPVADELGAPIVWAAGNHDERAPMRQALGLPGEPDDPIDTVLDLDQLRIVSLDTSMPGYHHGGFDGDQAAWLEDALADPPALGTVLVMHHPPLPYRSAMMRLIEFRDEARLAAVLGAGDVRVILSGHLHVAGSGTFAEIPVVLANAASYADDLGGPPPAMHGIDATQSFNVLELYPDAIAHSVVPALQHPSRETLPVSLVERVLQLPPEERAERFSRKPD